ncbi:helix-turn-helix transcriptional regulator [Actinoallomurus sp. NPDC050550]|uniref:helix-turn-helix domain-containing protein n=1 Tax=Actinoallomurus sp. NPDC050550 TaxID=3154937 RepID=UPI00340C5B47
MTRPAWPAQKMFLQVAATVCVPCKQGWSTTVAAVTVRSGTMRAEQPMNSHGRRDAGAIVRSTRHAHGLTLAELGRRTGYSASQVSRYERGLVPLTDTMVLRRFATALALPPQAFGLLPDTGERVTCDAHAPTVVADAPWEDGDDPVRRREFLAGAAGLTAAGALSLPGPARAARAADPTGGLENLLYGHGLDGTKPVPLPTLRTATGRARALFQAARYDRLAAELPHLIGTATATCDHADGDERLAADALLADAYIVASSFMVKLNDDQLAWATADRAAQAAEASGDALVLADARRSVATVMRRTGRSGRAHALLIGTAEDLAPGHNATPEQLSMYGTLLQTAAYTAAVDGDRSGAHDLIGAAEAASTRLGQDANYRHTAFGPTNVALYRVSIAQVLGDNGAAIAHAKTVNPATIPTAERRGRYWVDVARAWHQWGKPEACYRALLTAERAAPAEVRYRPPVRHMTTDLLRTDRRGTLPGLRAFATRVGVPI